MKLRLAVVFGGRSGEHDIAIRSARTVVEQADPERYDIIPIAIDHAGNWMSPEASLALFPDETQSIFKDRYGSLSSKRLVLSGDTSAAGLVTDNETVPLDCVFPVLHGTFGEDGTIQGLF